MGLGIVDRQLGGEVISGGKAVWLAEEPGEDTAGGDVEGDVEDITVVIIRAEYDKQPWLPSCAERY